MANRKIKPASFIIIFGFLLIFITCLVIGFLLWIKNENSSQIVFVSMIGLICLFVFLDFDKRIRRTAKIFYNETTEEKYPRDFIISEKGFHEINSHENNHKLWTDFERNIITQNYILLFHDQAFVYFIYAIEQMLYLIFLKRLEDKDNERKKAAQRSVDYEF